MKQTFITLILGLSGSLMVSAASLPSILEFRHSITDDNIIAPESFETQTRLLEENFYLKNYVVPGIDTGNSTTATATEYEQRLAKLPTVIDLPYNSIVGNYIDMYLTRKRGLVADMLALHNYYGRFFEEELLKEGMPLELEYLPVIESAINPNAVSRAGAVGLWQFMPATALDLGLEVNSLVDQRRDPRLASHYAVKYLKQLYGIYGDWSLAIAAYNCGPGNVNKALRRAGGGKHDFWDIYAFLPAETRGYVPAFIAANYIMNYHKDHNISPALARRPIITDTVHVSRRIHFDQISEVLAIPMNELRALNPQFRQDVIPGDIKPYALVLPSLQTLAYIANEDSIANHNATRYARRGVVEPSSGASVGRDSRGEYYEEEVIIYHTVRRGETLSKIAQKYGVSVKDIRKLNKVGKSVKRGKKLKIKTVERRYRPKTQDVPVTRTAEDDAADSTALVAANKLPASAASNTETSKSSSKAKADNKADNKSDAKVAAKAEQSSKAKAEKGKKKSNKAKATSYTVRKGDNLGKIAARHGITVKQLKKANGLKSDRIDIGQKLTIPAK